ncbi:hypothetical protein SCA6_004408 [Theobroma cacao]
MLSTKRSRASSSNSYQLLSSSSADLIASDDNILTLILLCLPLKCLLKFKTVSKHWLSLITDPRFSPKYDCRTASGLFARRLSGQTKAEYDFINLTPNPSRAPFQSLTFVDDPSGIRILQSCNGLLLCCSFRANRPETAYYIYNPTTKQYTVLPGLGPGPRGSDWGDSLCFDVEEERIRDLPMAPVVGDVRLYRYFGQSGGHLHLIEVYGSDTLQFDVYEMERDYSGWFVKYQVDLNPIAAAFPEMARGYVDPVDLHSYAFSILSVVQQESDEDSFLVLHLSNKAIRYNFKDGSFSKLHDFAPLRTRVGGDGSLEFDCYDAYQFTESFACV